jgi:hypothetical protein
MDSFIKLPAKERRQAFNEGFARMNLRPESIEKDFWVCWTLRKLFNLAEWGKNLTFKGGTSLSKGWELISRFSEDIDIVIDKKFLGFNMDNPSNNQLNKLKKKCGSLICDDLYPKLKESFERILPEEEEWSLEMAGKDIDPDLQTILFNYPAAVKSESPYVEQRVKIELGARSETEPIETPQIKPYIAEAFPQLIKDYTFEIRTISAKRTFWEKAMLLHEETFRPKDKPRKARLSRHYYDLWCLIEKGIANKAMRDLELFNNAAKHRQIFFRQNWVDYSTLAPGSLRLTPDKEQLEDWRKDYQAMKDVMFFEEPPDFDIILRVVKKFEDKFNTLKK